MSQVVAECFPDPYPLCKRDTGPQFWQISSDATSPDFHPSIMCSMCTGVTFPPYVDAGISDVVTYLRDGRRDSHVNDDAAIFGFMTNVGMHAMCIQEDVCEAYPEIAEFAAGVVARLNATPDGWKSLDRTEFARDIETRFGKTVSITPLCNVLAKNTSE